MARALHSCIWPCIWLVAACGPALAEDGGQILQLPWPWLGLPELATVCRLLIAAIFIVAAIGKLRHIEQSRQALRDFGVPPLLAGPLGVALPLLELGVGVSLVFEATAWWGAVAAAILFVTFGTAVSINLSLGRKPRCNCFGQLHSAPIGKTTLVSNGLGLVAASFLVTRGDLEMDPGIGALVRDVSLLQAVISGVVTAVAAACTGTVWFLLQIYEQNGRLLRRIEALEGKTKLVDQESRPPQHQLGLPRGTPAPPFELPALSGGRMSLAQLLGAGKRTVLAFLDPDCGPCAVLVPDLARWQQQHAAALQFVVVSSGSTAANGSKFAQHAIKHVLLQSDREVANAYRAYGTPSAVLVDREGRVESHVAQGVAQIAALVTSGADPPTPMLLQTPPPGPGVPAPDLTLAGPKGERIHVTDFRGRRLALLFWNPSCGFCLQMLERLRAWERGALGRSLSLLLVSSGSAEANERMGLRSPIALDPDFAAGRAFGVIGTPAALLIDETGTVASTLAVGAGQIFALFGEQAAGEQPPQLASALA